MDGLGKNSLDDIAENGVFSFIHLKALTTTAVGTVRTLFHCNGLNKENELLHTYVVYGTTACT